MRSFFRNKPKQPVIHDTTELLRQIERKDAMFRITQFVFFAVALSFLGALLVSNYRLQSENTSLLKTQNQTLTQEKQALDALKENDKHTAASFADLQLHIDCIVSLFTQPNRANLTLTNIKTCQFSPSASGGSTGSTKSGPVNATSQPTQVPATPTKTVAATTPAKTTSRPQPRSKHPLLCSLTLKLIGC